MATLTFKERMELRAKGESVPLTETVAVEEPVVTPLTPPTPAPVRRFGQPKEPTNEQTLSSGSGLPEGGGSSSNPADSGGSSGLAAASGRSSDSEAVPGVEEPAPTTVSRFGRSFGANPVGDSKRDTDTGQPTGARRFGAPKVSVDSLLAATEEPVHEPEAAPKETGPLPKVIQAFNAVSNKGQVASNNQTEGELLSGKEAPEAIVQIQQKIHELESCDVCNLHNEMAKLQKMLVDNPSACLYLLDEDTGLAVRALRRMTNNRVAIDMAAARPSKAAKAVAAKPLSQAEMESAWDDL